ncbi:MAG: D-alanine--D-alanine ligase family protein [Bryobacteraceae bacterium]
MKLRVAVVYGGRSGEHEISIRSAESIIRALDPEKYKVLHYFISKEGKWRPRPIVPEPGGNPEIDVVFPILHGTFGEDGTVQGMLELAELPYVGSGVLASSLAMDKEMTKRVCAAAGIPVVEYRIVHRGQFDLDALESALPYPMFVKPANLGSSVGISKAHNRAELEAALTLASQFDYKVIVERGVAGREFECAVLGNEDPQASIPCEILPSREFYDYEDKYILNQAKTVLPTDLIPSQSDGMRQIAVDAYKAVGCEGMARVDFLLEAHSGEMFINEINTIPGFTSISMYPKMWEATGVSYTELVDRLIRLALERHKIRRANRYTR